MVSAPFQSTNRQNDVGRVFIFLGTGDNEFLQPINETLSGDDVEQGRFGRAMANLGDINADGYDDVAISAPYEESGVVYIFNGQPNAVNMKYSQKIKGKRFHPGITSFGLYISEPRDMDGNKYPDFAVGSPQSDRVTLFRTRPIVNVFGSFEIYPSLIPLNSSGLDCSSDGSTTPCTTARICFSFTEPASFEFVNTTYVTYSLYVDVDRVSRRLSSRVHILFDKTYSHEMTIDNRAVSKGQTCESIFIQVTNADRQFFSTLEEDLDLVMNYSLSAGPVTTGLLPALNSNSRRSFTQKARFQTGCSGSCHPDLRVTMKTEQPAIIIGETKDLNVQVTLINADDPAFVPTATITFTNYTKYTAYQTLFQQGSVLVSCSLVNNQTVRCSCGNRLLQHQTAIFRLVFDVSEQQLLPNGFINVTTEDIPSTIALNVFAEVSSGNDDNFFDNSFDLSVPVEFHTNLELMGISLPEQGFIADGTEYILLTHSYEVYNAGPSPMLNSKVTILLPKSSEGKGILDVNEIGIGTDIGTTNCTKTNRYSPRIGSAGGSEDENDKKKIFNMDCANSNCIELACTLLNLEVDQSIEINLQFKLDAKNISFSEVTSINYITTGFILQGMTSTFSRILSNVTTEVVTELFPGEATLGTVEPLNIWIIIGGVVGGVALLIVLGAIMWKFGFFKRAKKEQVDEYKRKSNYYEKRRTQRLEAARSKAMSKAMSRSDEVILHQK